MASLGICKFQDLVGRTDMLRVRESCMDKAKLLDMSHVLKNALEMRPETNIVGGSIKQVSEHEVLPYWYNLIYELGCWKWNTI